MLVLVAVGEKSSVYIISDSWIISSNFVCQESTTEPSYTLGDREADFRCKLLGIWRPFPSRQKKKKSRAGWLLVIRKITKLVKTYLLLHAVVKERYR